MRDRRYISLLVESIIALDVSEKVLVAVDDLVWGTHLEEVSRLFVVAIVDSLDDGLYLWCLDQIK